MSYAISKDRLPLYDVSLQINKAITKYPSLLPFTGNHCNQAEVVFKACSTPLTSSKWLVWSHFLV